MGKRWASIALVASLSGAFVVVAAPRAGALSGTESCFFNSINAERVDVGRPKLVLKSDLVTVARKHSEKMAADGTIYHNGNLKNEVGGNWWALGENVGMGPSCASIHNAFLDSPGHKANILDKDYNQAGVGVVVKDDYIYITEVFVGRPTGPAPKPNVTTQAPAVATVKPKPKPVPRQPALEPRTMTILLVLLGMDAARVDPATGAAMGV